MPSEKAITEYYKLIASMLEVPIFKDWAIYQSGQGPMEAHKYINGVSTTIKGFDSRIYGWQIHDLLRYIDDHYE